MTLENKELLEQIKSDRIEFIDLLFTDIIGVPKTVTVPLSTVENALDHGVWFDGSSVEGFARIYESDMLLKLDVDTYAVLPWSESDGRRAQIICDVYRPNEQPFSADPRSLLKRVMKRAEEMGYTFYVGPEIEFFLLDRSQLPSLVPHDRKGYFDLGVQSKAVTVCQDTMKDMESFGVYCESHHHEVSHGQHEIDLKYDHALKIADGIICLKHTLRTHAMAHDLKVSFMPKPIFGINGNGMHVHQSLGDGKGKNLFYSKDDPYNISDLAYHFLAGQINHARSLVAIVAPTVNSYKRLVPGFEAPVYVCWGRVNRSALIRIPMVSQSKVMEGSRLELRCPDPSCNPYLAFASMLAAGLDGIENKSMPQPAVEENVYGFSDEKLNEMAIAMLPGTLGDAVRELQKDEMLQATLGKELTEHFVHAKLQEWEEFLIQVTSWEVERYL
jgi:glutamine synthetase